MASAIVLCDDLEVGRVPETSHREVLVIGKEIALNHRAERFTIEDLSLGEEDAWLTADGESAW